jgi:hypothetical protein
MIKASIKVDVAQGDDPDALVAEMFARSIDPETLMKMIIRPTGKIGGGGHPEWEIEGNTIAVLIALLNYSGFDVHMVEELANTFSGITFTEVFDPDYEPDIAVGRPTEIVNFGEHGFDEERWGHKFDEAEGDKVNARLRRDADDAIKNAERLQRGQ